MRRNAFQGRPARDAQTGYGVARFTFNSFPCHVIDSGDFFTVPGPVYDQVLDFLGLPDHGRPAFTPQNARPRSPMPDTLRAALEEHYRPHDERLSAWLGRAPSWRR